MISMISENARLLYRLLYITVATEYITRRSGLCKILAKSKHTHTYTLFILIIKYYYTLGSFASRYGSKTSIQ